LIATTSEADTARDELRRGWRPLVASCIGLALGLSPHTAYTIGIVAGPLGESLGWPRSSVLGATMAATLAVILLGTTTGRLVDRLGARRVALVSTAGVGLGLLLLSTAGGSVSVFYGLWGIMTMLGLGTLPMTYAKIITAWFNKSRGLALGLMLASTGLAGATYPFYIDGWIDAIGWRGAFVGLALLPLLISLPLQFFWLRERPATAQAETAAAATTGLTLGQAVRHHRFWVSALAAMLLNAASGGLLTNFLPLLTEAGLPHSQAIQALSVLALSITAGRLLCGVMLDRLWAPVVAAILIAPAIAGVLVLTADAIDPLLAIGCVVLVGLVTGAEFDLMAFIISRYFGRSHYSEIFGLQFAIFAIGSGASPILFGRIHDRTGSYDPLLFVSAAMLAGAALLLFTLGRYPKAYEQAAHG
jgi:OFA family oxalate/formate antiporter-like MFS transporter